MNIDLAGKNCLGLELVEWPLPIHEVLYEAEQPIVFLTYSSVLCQPLLAYLADEESEESSIILASASSEKISNLKKGIIGVREALVSDWMWLVRGSHSDGAAKIWAIRESDVPDGYLPVHGTPLLPEHTVVFSARALGDDIALGRMPCIVVSLVADAVRSSLKVLLDHVRAANTEGRPKDAQRKLYDLPVQRLRFSSFEVGLAEPDHGLFRDESMQVVISSLTRGLKWAQDAAGQVSLGEGDAEELDAILRATLALTPPGSGVVREIEVSGAWLQGRRFRLDRNARLKVSKQLRAHRAEKIVVYKGRIGEVDDDNLSITIRDTSDGVDRKGFLREEFWDEVRAHYYYSNRVAISGIERNGRLNVTAVVAQDDPDE